MADGGIKGQLQRGLQRPAHVLQSREQPLRWVTRPTLGELPKNPSARCSTTPCLLGLSLCGLEKGKLCHCAHQEIIPAISCFLVKQHPQQLLQRMYAVLVMDALGNEEQAAHRELRRPAQSWSYAGCQILKSWIEMQHSTQAGAQWHSYQDIQEEHRGAGIAYPLPGRHCS